MLTAPLPDAVPVVYNISSLCGDYAKFITDFYLLLFFIADLASFLLCNSLSCE